MAKMAKKKIGIGRYKLDRQTNITYVRECREYMLVE